eukprot:3032497-Pleurochrysis_carterae.AAC.1
MPAEGHQREAVQKHVRPSLGLSDCSYGDVGSGREVDKSWCSYAIVRFGRAALISAVRAASRRYTTIECSRPRYEVVYSINVTLAII